MFWPVHISSLFLSTPIYYLCSSHSKSTHSGPSPYCLFFYFCSCYFLCAKHSYFPMRWNFTNDSDLFLNIQYLLFLGNIHLLIPFLTHNLGYMPKWILIHNIMCYIIIVYLFITPTWLTTLEEKLHFPCSQMGLPLYHFLKCIKHSSYSINICWTNEYIHENGNINTRNQ